MSKDFSPNRLRHWAEAYNGPWRKQAPAAIKPDVLLGLAEAWDADKEALQAMTEEANAEGGRATKAEAEVRELRAALEQARALVSRWRDTLCLFPDLEDLVDEIDALLALDLAGGETRP